MTKYKINRIYIENFKLIEKAYIDLNDEHLVVLDGPNGFGKTTIFDALELALTGKIYRIKNLDGREGFNTVLYCKDDKKDIVIKIEFVFQEHYFTLVKKYSARKILRSQEKKPDNWSLFETFKVDHFDDPISEENKITLEDIDELFGTENLNRFYHLFYYIQQEENTFFLKKAGKERMEQIGELFDTKKESEEMKALVELRKTFHKEKKATDLKIEEIDKNIKKYNFEFTIEEQGPGQDTVEYSSLFKDQSIKIEWDKKDLVINSKTTRDKFIQDILDIEDFILHFDDFKKSQFNQKINQYASNKKLLTDVIIGSYFLDSYSDIKINYEKQNKIKSLREKLQKEKFQQLLGQVGFSSLIKELNIDIDDQVINERLSIIIKNKNNASDVSKIVKKLNDTRVSLLNHFNDFSESHEHQQGECPLCGYDWEDYENLITEVDAKRKNFDTFYDDSTKKIEEGIEELYKDHFDEVIKFLDEFLSDSNNIIDDKFFLKLEAALKRKNEIQLFVNWCNKKNIDFSEYINKTMNKSLDNFESDSVDKIISLLKLNKKNVSEGYSDNDETFNKFELLYNDTFKGLDENVSSVTEKAIKEKKRYIDFVFYHQNTQKIEEENRKRGKLTTIQQKLSEKIVELKNIIDIYDTAIKLHWNKIMKDIEIPFYIFSGKIIQEYQKGLGIFIEESQSGQAQSIKFVSDNRSNHDAINYLSSGQLSALVIAFTLALNKVYGGKSLDVIFIDDPVQTMDEINMASLTELLRNDFSNKQIIISTHEDDVSRYLRYKFKKYGLNAMKFNVKEDMFQAN